MIRPILLILSLLSLSMTVIAQNGESDRPAGDFFVVASISNPTPYLGERILYTFRYYAYDTSRLVEPDPVRFPDFQRFYVGDIFDRGVFIETVGGVQYNVGELIVELVALTTGRINIAPTALLVEDTLFLPGGEFNTAIVPVDVRPLPPDAPPSFNGAVGQYAMSASVDRLAVEIGQPVRLTMDIQGTGTFPLLPPPRLDFGMDWRVISGTPQAIEEPDRTVINLPFGRRVFEWLLIPQVTGALDLSDIRFSFFDPVREQYVESDPWDFMIVVTRSASGITDLSANVQPEVQLSLKPIQSPPQASRTNPPEFLWGLWLLMPLIAIGAGFVTLYTDWQDRKASEHRRRYALQRALRRLDVFDDDRPIEALSRELVAILRRYISDKVDADGVISVIEIEDVLTAHDISRTVIALYDAAMTAAQSLVYAPSRAFADTAQVVDMLRQAITRIDESWPPA